MARNQNKNKGLKLVGMERICQPNNENTLHIEKKDKRKEAS